MKKITVLFAFISILFASCSVFQETQQSNIPRKPVDAVDGRLTLHPDSIAMTTNNGIYSFFLDKGNKIIFMTDNQRLYPTFASFLPELVVPGRSIVLEATYIDPFTIFTKDQFEELNKRMLTLGLQLNSFKVARIFNYGLVGYSPNPQFQINQQNQNPKKTKNPWNN